MVKAACLLVMTWMMMGSDLTDLFVAARLMSHITKRCACAFMHRAVTVY